MKANSTAAVALGYHVSHCIAVNMRGSVFWYLTVTSATITNANLMLLSGKTRRRSQFWSKDYHMPFEALEVPK